MELGHITSHLMLVGLSERKHRRTKVTGTFLLAGKPLLNTNNGINMQTEITIEQAKRVLEVIDAGLCRGVGKPKLGHMCVEAAVCYGLDLPFGDNPQCVNPVVRAFKIRLNDARWSSNAARAKGMRAVGIAQLGSNGTIDSVAFGKKLAELTIRRIVSTALRATAKKVSKHHSTTLILAAEKCEKEGTLEAALSARTAAYADAAYAAADAAYAAAARDTILEASAQCAVDALRFVNAPGIKLMDELILEVK